VDHQHRSLRVLGNTLIVLLAVQLVLAGIAIGLHFLPLPWYLIRLVFRLRDAGAPLAVLTVIVFLLWFRRARINAEASGYPQRWRTGWWLVCWLIPIANLFIPYQMLADIWRASLPEEQRHDSPWLPRLWWVCVLASFVGPADWGMGPTAAAAGLAIIIVSRVTDSPIG
jgi:hypothetical protein